MAQSVDLIMNSTAQETFSECQTSVHGDTNDTLVFLCKEQEINYSNESIASKSQSANLRLSAGPLAIENYSNLFKHHRGVRKFEDEEPNSAANIQRKPSKLRIEKKELNFDSYYERIEQFLDESKFQMVQPTDETKVRKYIKVLTIPVHTSAHQSDSHLYEGSPSLKNVSGASLLARRTSSLKASTDLSISSTESSPLSNNSPVNGLTPQLPKRYSKFSGKSVVESVVNEEKKTEVCSPIHDGENLIENKFGNSVSEFYAFSDFIQEPEKSLFSGQSLRTVDIQRAVSDY